MDHTIEIINTMNQCNIENSAISESSSVLTYKMLKSKGSQIPGYEEYMKSREYTRVYTYIQDYLSKKYYLKTMLPYVRAYSNHGYQVNKYCNIMLPNDPGIFTQRDQDEFVCPAQIPGCEIDTDHWMWYQSNHYNPVHCVAPQCDSDPHHKNHANPMTYWCPVCDSHTYSMSKCAENCNNCLLHGPDCMRLADDIDCPSPQCEYDPHHHIYPRKKNHRYCSKCNGCHDKSLKYCDHNKCKKCFLMPHCDNKGCESEPHHGTLDYFCSQCDKCLSNPSNHCDSSDCIKDPHHLDQKFNHVKCDRCFQCHHIGLKNIIKLPNVIVKIITSYICEPNERIPYHNFFANLTYCDQCKKCYTHEHCKELDCTTDPHHIRVAKMDHMYCEKCKKCHPKKLNIHCNHCSQCTDGIMGYHHSIKNSGSWKLICSKNNKEVQFNDEIGFMIELSRSIDCR